MFKIDKEKYLALFFEAVIIFYIENKDTAGPSGRAI